MRHRFLLFFPILSIPLWAQDQAGTQALMRQILQRMDALEQQNRQLVDEVHALRQELDRAQSSAQNVAPDPSPQNNETPLEDRVAVAERRINEQAQTKVEASQKFPISLNGMLLFNAFYNRPSPNSGNAGEYGLLSGPERVGATVRQTILGLQLQGPTLPAGGRVNGTLLMDFWAGYANPGSSWVRLRRADISLDWQRRSFTVGQDKPLIAPYQPDSLAEVGVPPLAGAGHL